MLPQLKGSYRFALDRTSACPYVRNSTAPSPVYGFGSTLTRDRPYSVVVQDVKIRASISSGLIMALFCYNNEKKFKKRVRYSPDTKTMDI